MVLIALITATKTQGVSGNGVINFVNSCSNTVTLRAYVGGASVLNALLGSNGTSSKVYYLNNGESMEGQIKVGSSIIASGVVYGGQTITITSCGAPTNPPCTNITLTVVNKHPYLWGTAYWYRNAVKSQGTKIIGPGESESKTYPCVEAGEQLQWGITYYYDDAPYYDEVTGDLTVKPQTGDVLGGTGTGGNIIQSSGGTSTNAIVTNNVTTPISTGNSPSGNPNDYTNNIIQFSGGGGGGATESTLETGINALLASEIETRRSIAGGVGDIIKAIENQGSGTNTAAWTNGLTQEQLEESVGQYGQNNSNKLGTLSASMLTAREQDAYYMQMQTLMSDLPSSAQFDNYQLPTDSGGGGGGGPILAFTASGNQISMELNASTHSSAGVIKAVLKWCVLLALFIQVQKSFFDACDKTLRTSQATTAGEAALGTNVNAASALVMASLIVAAVFTMAAFLSGFVIAGGASLAATNPYSLWSSLGEGATFLGSVLPWEYLMTGTLAYIAYDMVKGTLMVTTMSIVKFLTGL